MPKHWVYVLQCSGDRLYVGETTRLYRRLLEHIRHVGGKNTYMHHPQKLIGLYCLDKNVPNPCADHHDFENFITELLMLYHASTWYLVHGGTYTKYKIEPKDVNNSVNEPKRKESLEDRPFCKCGLPCERRTNEIHNYEYFCCSKHNIWPKMVSFFKSLKSSAPTLEISDEACDFYSKTDKKNCIKVSESTDIMKQNLCPSSIFLENASAHAETDIVMMEQVAKNAGMIRVWKKEKEKGKEGKICKCKKTKTKTRTWRWNKNKNRSHKEEEEEKEEDTGCKGENGENKHKLKFIFKEDDEEEEEEEEKMKNEMLE